MIDLRVLLPDLNCVLPFMSITRYFFFTFAFLYSVSACSQAEDKVRLIRFAVERINGDTSYLKKTLENEQFLEHMTDGGGALTGYFKNGKLVKLVERVGLSSCISIYEYYFENGQLIFVYRLEKVFPYDNESGLFDYTKQEVSMECRFYLVNGKLIRSKFSGEPRCGNQPSVADLERLLKDGKKYSALFKK